MRSFSFIRSSTQSRVAWIEFYRRPVNAFTRDMVVDTRDAIASALSDPTARVRRRPSRVRANEGAGHAPMGIVVS